MKYALVFVGGMAAGALLLGLAQTFEWGIR